MQNKCQERDCIVHWKHSWTEHSVQDWNKSRTQKHTHTFNPFPMVRDWICSFICCTCCRITRVWLSVPSLETLSSPFCCYSICKVTLAQGVQTAGLYSKLQICCWPSKNISSQKNQLHPTALTAPQSSNISGFTLSALSFSVFLSLRGGRHIDPDAAGKEASTQAQDGSWNQE